MVAGLIGVSTGLKTFNKFPHVFSEHVVETFDFVAGGKVCVSFGKAIPHVFFPLPLMNIMDRWY